MRTGKKRIIISAVCGVLAAILMAGYAYTVQSNARQSRSQILASYGGEQIEVYVAVRNIASGERLTTANVTKQTWLADLLPAGALSDEGDVIGQTLGIPLLANEPVVSCKLSTTTNSINIPEGYCAVSIPTNDVLAVGGAVSSGSVIAVYAADKESVELIAAEVLVLETSNDNRSISDDSGLFGTNHSRSSLSWVTLIVSEDMVADLIAASRSRNLYLVLPGGEL